jgi:hypothetical protein
MINQARRMETRNSQTGTESGQVQPQLECGRPRPQQYLIGCRLDKRCMTVVVVAKANCG